MLTLHVQRNSSCRSEQLDLALIWMIFQWSLESVLDDIDLVADQLMIINRGEQITVLPVSLFIPAQYERCPVATGAAQSTKINLNSNLSQSEEDRQVPQCKLSQYFALVWLVVGSDCSWKCTSTSSGSQVLEFQKEC
ncbi:hypothetical protein Tco_1576614 [Tanacetum coccineum]